MTTLTQEYIDNQLRPYNEALKGVTNMDDLRNWIPLIITEPSMLMAFTSVIHTDAKTSVMNVSKLLTDVLVEGALQETEDYSPWDITRNKTPLAEQLFGPRGNTIAVTVNTPTNVFTHELTEEQVLGIIIGLQGQPINNPVQIFIGTHEMTIADVGYWQQYRIQVPTRYKIIIGDNTILFETPDFIQGLITGLGWRGTNIQTLGATIYEVSEAGDIPIVIS